MTAGTVSTRLEAIYGRLATSRETSESKFRVVQAKLDLARNEAPAMPVFGGVETASSGNAFGELPHHAQQAASSVKELMAKLGIVQRERPASEAPRYNVATVQVATLSSTPAAKESAENALG